MKNYLFRITLFVVVVLAVFTKSYFEDCRDSFEVLKLDAVAFDTSVGFDGDHDKQQIDCDFCHHHHHFDFAFLDGQINFAKVDLRIAVFNDPSYFSNQSALNKEPPRIFV